MKKYIYQVLKDTENFSDADKVKAINTIYICLEKDGHTPQAIKRAIEEVIKKHKLRID
jgi:predicted ATP-dependent protease